MDLTRLGQLAGSNEEKTDETYFVPSFLILHVDEEKSLRRVFEGLTISEVTEVLLHRALAGRGHVLLKQ